MIFGIPLISNWDLNVLDAHFEFAIGFAFYLTTPEFKLRYADVFTYRCISIGVSMCGAGFYIAVPLYKESDL